MKDSVRAGVLVYNSTVTKYIIGTICLIIIIRVLHNVTISLSGCNNFRENASRAVELGGKAYTAYQDIRQPQRFVRQ